MRPSASRRAAVAIGRLAARLMPARSSAWAAAMGGEIAAIEGDGAAVLFALGCLRAALGQRLVLQMKGPGRGVKQVTEGNRGFGVPAIGAMCAMFAVGLGLINMALAGAPGRYLFVNGAAVIIGLILLSLTGPWLRQALARGGALPDLVTALLTLGLLATALFGVSTEGARRWLTLGAIAIQPSLVLLPPLVLIWARRRTPAASAALGVAALALALQPDRAMAGTLLLGVAAVTALKPGRAAAAGLILAAAAFAATFVPADRLPAVPYVDGVFYSSFATHPLAGLAVLAGAALLIVPAIVGWCTDRDGRAVHAAFAALWFGIAAAAALGNYPTPLVGYGASAVLGYLLGLAALAPRPSQAGAEAGGERPAAASGNEGLRMAASIA